MFGKKKKNESENVAPSEKKSGKKSGSASAKYRVTANRGPNFFVSHVEKIALGAVMGLAGFLVYSSLSSSTLPSSHSPENLSGEAQKLLNQVRNESHWDAIYSEREQFDRHQFHASTIQARMPADATNYAIGKLEPPAVREHYEQRRDPEILPVEQIVVQSVSGTLGIWELVSDRERDPFLKFEDADPIGRRPRRPSRGSDSEQGSNSTESSPGVRQLPAKYDLGAQFGSYAGSGSSGMGAGGGFGGGGLGPGGGMGPGGGGLGGQGGAGGPGGSGSNEPDVGGVLLGSGPQRGSSGELLSDEQRIRYRLGSRPVVFNAVTALIPHRKNEEEYFRVFSRTGTFLAGRDTPVYLGVEVQRVDVTADVNRAIQEDDWQTILTNKEIQETPTKFRWATHLPQMRPKIIADVVHERYSLPGLTAPIVPLLVRDYREFSKHPLIEWRWNTRLPSMQQKSGDKSSGSTDDESDVVFGQGGGVGGSAGSEGGGLGGPGGGMGGLGGNKGAGDSGMDDSGFGMGDSGFGGPGGASGFGEEGGSPGFGMGGPGGAGPGSGGTGGFSGGWTEATIALQPEYKMIRVHDFLKFEDIGRTFRYRVRVAMRDPNYPENQDYMDAKYSYSYLTAPGNDELSHEVYERVSALRRKEDSMIRDAVQKKIYKARTMRYSPWSEPSHPVSAATPVEVFAGEVDTKGTAKVVVAQLNRSSQLPGAIMAAEVAVQKGNLLGLPPTNTDFIAPTLKVIKRADRFSMLTGAVVVDTRGGAPLAGHNSRDDPQTIKGEVMVLRPDGSLIFSNDLDDQFLYRMYSFQDDIEAARARQNSGDRSGGGPGMSGQN